MEVYIGQKSELINSGKMHIVEISGVSIGVYMDDDNAYAVRNMCPHKQAPVCRGLVGGTMQPSDPCEFKFVLDNRVLQCPWHGWEFDLRSGESLFGISNRKLKTYSIEVKEDDGVYITV